MSSCGGSTRVPIKLTDRVELGESPHWDACKQVLYFVDMAGHAVHCYDPVTKRHNCARVAGNKDVTLILPVEGQPDRFVIGYDGDLALISWDGHCSDLITEVETYAECEPAPDVRLNDGKTSPSGVIVVGSMAKKLPDLTVPKGKGNVFLIDTRDDEPKVKTLLEKIDLSNGLCWNPDETHFFWADTTRRKVYKYDYDKINLSIRNERVLVDYEKEKLKGNPDGMTMDRDGKIWCCCVDGGGELIRICSATGAVLERIPFPGVSDVASVAFGGKNLDELFITTISRKEEPLSGCLFVLRDLGTSGYPGVPARI